jgi:surfactin synthase thioesterase subunit
VTMDDMRSWGAVAPRAFDLHVLPGDHFYLVAQRAALIASITTHLK